MKKSLLFLAVLGVLGLVIGNQGRAVEPATVKSFKVAIVDFQRAINETEEGKKAEATLNAALEEKKKKFEILKQELDSLRQDFEKQRLVLSGKLLDEKRDVLQKKLIEVEQTGMGYEQDLSQKKAQSLQNIVMGLQTVVREIGGQDKYDFIFEKSQGGVLYSPIAEDITDRVIKTYNNRSPKK